MTLQDNMDRWKAKGPIRRKIAKRLEERKSRSSNSGAGETSVNVEGCLEDEFDDLGEEVSSCNWGEDSEEPKKKPWLETSKEVYEQQLQTMQEQLENAMFEKMALEAELEEYKKSSTHKKELAKLRQENKELNKRIDNLQRGTSLSEGASVSSLHTTSSYGGSMLSVTTSEEGYERVSIQSDKVSKFQQRGDKPRGSIDSFKDWAFDFLSDFTEEHSSPSDQDGEATPLTAKRLKDNLKRLAKSSKPWRGFVTFIQEVLHWRNTAESLVAFLIYMYCVWHGWIIQLFLFLAILKLSLNYLHTSGLAEQFGLQAQQRSLQDSTDSLGLSDKLHLMKQVGQKVQNTSGDLSDSLEKAHNLFLWYQPEATRRLYIILWVFLITSLFLPNSYTLTIAGLGIGIKLFIIDNIYRKYPKVKEKHDTVHRLWLSLPTDAELLQRQSLTAEQMHSLPRTSITDSNDDGNLLTGLTEEESSFCSRFQLSPDELPLTSWTMGRRCTLLDKDHPLIGTKSGKLYITHSFLGFERTNKLRDPDRFLISLADVEAVSKAKPFAVLPGSGMAIEISVKSSEKPILFGAILHRDQVYKAILDQGLILGLPWGTDPDEGGSPSTTGEGQNDASETPTNLE